MQVQLESISFLMLCLRIMETYGAIEQAIQYSFHDRALLEEALVTAGSPATTKISGEHTCGNKRLALLGDALLRLAIVDEWFDDGSARSKPLTKKDLPSNFINYVADECEKKVQDLASNEHLNDQGQKMGFQQVVFKNPCQGGEVPRTAMASTLEAVIGATWLDSGRDWRKVYSVAKIVSESQ